MTEIRLIESNIIEIILKLMTKGGLADVYRNTNPFVIERAVKSIRGEWYPGWCYFR